MSPQRWRQIEELYQAAREQGAGALAHADPELRREVEALLAQDTSELPAAGLTLGPYKLEAKIGAGGMGEVYRALDTKLHRPVAVKFLSERLGHPTDVRRFQREAQMASSLNHPHILTVYDVGEWEGRPYLATEYVDGGTLRDWARSAKRTWREIVELLVGVADGLATAHEARILHRDIKPANILVTKSGYAKLADFGLAKLVEPPSPSDLTKTLSEHGTTPGAVIGTIAYMSPEQAAGQTLDARSDIFSFGVVLYELLSGRRPFAGATDLETLQKVMHAPMPPLGAEFPTPLRLAAEKALAKDPAERYQSMREMVIDLRRIARQTGERDKLNHGKWALAAVLVAAGVLGWRVWRAPRTAEPLRAVPVTTLRGLQRYPSLSPDGNRVAFTWTGPKQDNPDIYVQQIGAGAPLRLTTDPNNDYNPVWSPDDRWIAFLRGQPAGGVSELRLIPPLGGPERKLADIHVRNGFFVIPPHLAWCPDSSCVVATDSPAEGQPEALFAVSLESGEKRQLTHPPERTGDSNPSISPDGRWLVFRRNPNALFTGALYRQALGRGLMPTGDAQRITQPVLDAAYPAWLPGSKEILFSRPLETARSGLQRLLVAGENQPERLPFVGEDGLMAVVSRPQPGRPARLVYVHSYMDGNIWRIDTAAAGAASIAPPVLAVGSSRMDGMPQMSSDGRRVAFWSNRSGDSEIWLADPDGSNVVQLTSMGPGVRGYPHWSPDGRVIVFHSAVDGQWDLFAVPAIGGKPRNLTSTQANDFFPRFSRDGRWIYFTSNRTKEGQIWKMPASGGEAVALAGAVGYAPQESPDGAYVYYVQTVNGPSSLWRVPASGGVPAKVLEGVIIGNYEVIERGIYYIDRPAGQGDVHYFDLAPGETRLQYFDFATRRATTVTRGLGTVDMPLTVSADGRTILYPRMDSALEDLMLVENFR